MKLIYLSFALLAFSMFSCGGLGETEHIFIDANTGLTVSSSVYPSDWEVISRPTYTMDQKIPVFLIQIQGPDNLKAFNTPLKFHLSYQNPQTARFMSNSGLGQMIRPEASVKQISQQEVEERMKKSGFEYESDRDISTIVNYVNGKLGGGNGMRLEPLATVWTNKQGQKALVTILKLSQQQPFMYNESMTTWFYSIDYLFAEEGDFEEAIVALERSLLQSQENPEWEQYLGHLSQQRAQIATQQHQARMRNQQASFEAHQRKMKGIYAAQEANHNAFMDRTFGSGSNSSHQNYINSIREEETVYNPLSGENYQVDAGAKEYWMDSDGNYIKNDDLFYTPNGDINLNNREWVQVGQ